MDTARADILAARHHLQRHGWIGARDECFRHLPPPSQDVWLPGEPGACQGSEPRCGAPPLAGAGWALHALADSRPNRVQAQWLDATEPAEREALFAGVMLPEDDGAAALAWAHRAACLQGLRLRIGGAFGPPAHPGEVVRLHLRYQPRAVVDAPMLVLELLPGERVVLVESHERDPHAPDGGGCALALSQNLHLHVRLGAGADLQHVRIVAPATQDHVAHHVQVHVEAGARYRQTVLASGGAYHLQRTEIALDAPHAVAHVAGALFAADTALEQRVRLEHAAANTHSVLESLALASGAARAVINGYTRIAPDCHEAEARQRLGAIPTGGQPRLVLRPHLEIHHDHVQAAHGATWGQLPEDALFYARTRGLDETRARALIVDGLITAIIERCVDDPEVRRLLAADATVPRLVRRHLSPAVAETTARWAAQPMEHDHA